MSELSDRLKLQAPKGAGSDRWEALYHATGDEINPNRPVFTGDVVLIQSVPVAVLQHPCALRLNGVDLQPRVLVGQVQGWQRLTADQWAGNYKLMPLPTVATDDSNDSRISFVDLDVINSDLLENSYRLANLSEAGVNLLLQRWIHHNSRVVVPTHSIQEVTSGPFAEAELVEEWCDTFTSQGLELGACRAGVHKWLRERESGMNLSRQEMLEDVEQRSAVRRAMRQRLREPFDS